MFPLSLSLLSLSLPLVISPLYLSTPIYVLSLSSVYLARWWDSSRVDAINYDSESRRRSGEKKKWTTFVVCEHIFKTSGQTKRTAARGKGTERKKEILKEVRESKRN